MKKRNKIIVAASVLAIVGVAGVTIGTTTALFKREIKTNVHIQTGNLDGIKFYLTHLEYDQVSDDGLDITRETIDLSTMEGYVEDLGKVDLSLLTGSIAVINGFLPSMGGSYTLEIVNGSDIVVDASITTGLKAYDKDDQEFDVTEADFEVDSIWSGSSTKSEEEKTLSKDESASAVVTFVFKYDSELENTKFDIDSTLLATQYAKNSSN